MRVVLASLLLSLMFMPSFAATKLTREIVDGFDNGAALKSHWSAWGAGEVEFDAVTGYKRNGSVRLFQEDFGQTNFYRKFENLEGPFVRVSFQLRASRLGSSSQGEALLLLARAGGGESESVETVSHWERGSFDWVFVSAILPVKKGTLELWWRLKAPGKVWIDDFKIEAQSKAGAKTKAIAPRGAPLIFSPLKLTAPPTHCLKAQGQREKEIYAPFNLSAHKYHHLDPKVLAKALKGTGNWLRFYVDAPSSGSQLFFTISDRNSKGYWDQLNHSMTLVKGRNLIQVDLRQWVGERGSVRKARRIDYEALSKIYVVIDPDKKYESTANFKVGATSLLAPARAAFFEGLYAFDFSAKKEFGAECFIAVSAYDVKETGDEYGFVKPSFGQIQDSFYAPPVSRWALEMREGGFEVDLPNGEYGISLVASQLGYWDIPFWKKRLIEVNGTPLFLETRSSAEEYLEDYFRFESIEPRPHDHPYDLYLAPLLAPIEATVKVTNKKIHFNFSADHSGLFLNSLFIWKKGDEKKMESFLKDFSQQQRAEFDLLMNRKTLAPVASSNQRDAVILQRDLGRIEANQALDGLPQVKAIKETLLQNDQVLRGLVLFSSSTERVKVKVTGLEESGVKLSWYRGNYQFISADRNHQGYLLATKQLLPLNFEPEVEIAAGINEQLFVRFETQAISGGPQQVKGKIIISGKKIKEAFDLELNLIPRSLPAVDFPVGFFGLQSVPLTHFETPKASEVRLHYAKGALDMIANAGFTTWSGLAPLAKKKGAESKEIEELLSHSKSRGIDKAIFSYGGRFPEDLFAAGINDILAQKKWVDKLMNSPAGPKVIFSFSDEAHGYAQSVAVDIKRAKFLKENFPTIKRGGFSIPAPPGSELEALNRLFNVGSYATYDSSYMKQLNHQGRDWGLYNQASGPLDNPRMSFGAQLYKLRGKGMGHLLEWHLSGVHNYPYYDLDGRENDAMMLYPRSNGELVSTVKFEQARAGLRDYRLLKLLESDKGQTSFLKKFQKLRLLFDWEHLSQEEREVIDSLSSRISPGTE